MRCGDRAGRHDLAGLQGCVISLCFQKGHQVDNSGQRTTQDIGSLARFDELTVT